MNRQEDEPLGRLFAELRDRDERAVPAFGAIRQFGTVSDLRTSVTRWRLAAAAALLLAAGVTTGWLVLRARSRSDHRSVLSSWRSPTESLLRGPGDEILKVLPVLSESAVRFSSPRIDATQQRSESL